MKMAYLHYQHILALAAMAWQAVGGALLKSERK
jgi:hypothetical protein